MRLGRSVLTGLVLALALAGITALYGRPLATPFLNDDYLFLEQARTRPLIGRLAELDAPGNYYRPLSRQVYFAALTPLGGGSPRVFHLANYALFLVSLALLADLLRSLLPLPGVVAGVLYFALLPFQRVNLTWVSCGQDLMALAGVLGAVALWRRGRRGLALLPGLAAFASKESALPLPLALAAWELWLAPGRETAPLAARWPGAARRVAPMLALAAAWVALALAMHARHGAAPPIAVDPASFAAAYVHLAQALFGLEDPGGWWRAMRSTAPSLLALLLLAPLAFWARRRGSPEPAPATESDPAPDARHAAAFGVAWLLAPLAFWARRRGSPEPAPATESDPAPDARHAAAFGVAWLLAFGLAVVPVAWSWSAYYHTLAAVGSAVLVGVLMRRAGALAIGALLVALLWVHAGTNAVTAFAVSRSPWDGTSHVTSFYFDRAAALADSMSRQLVRLDPRPPDDARMFFANLPSYAGFQMGNGALIRALYRAPGIQSHFYTQFSESTAADHPTLFYYWNGERLLPLYRRTPNPHFHVGTDLLLLDRLDGAAHAFRRGLIRGEAARDHLYWLGWTELWRGRRDQAEALWTRYGARDDSLRWLAHMDAAYQRLLARDTLEARRHLITAIGYGIGRPEAHVILGGLLVHVHPKYGLLELEVGNRLDPSNRGVRRERVLGLAAIGYDDRARSELEILKRQAPGWRSDSALAATAARLEGGPAPGGMVRFR